MSIIRENVYGVFNRSLVFQEVKKKLSAILFICIDMSTLLPLYNYNNQIKLIMGHNTYDTKLIFTPQYIKYKTCNINTS